MNQEHTVSNPANDIAPSAMASPLYPTPPGLARPMRIVLAMPERVPAWLSTFVDLAVATGWIDVFVLPVTGATLPTVSKVPIDLKAFLAIERARRRRPDATLASAAVDARESVTIAEAIPVGAGLTRLTTRIRELQPDLVLSLAPRSWSETLADSAQWGCWNIDANIIDADSAGIALLASVLEGESATELVLELHGTTFMPFALATSWGTTHRGSFGQQREKAFLKLPLMLLRALHRLASDELPIPRGHSAQLRQARPESPLGFAAGARALAIAVYSTAQWQLAKRRPLLPWLLVLRQDGTTLDPGAPEVRSTAVIQAPAGHYWADPCAVETSGRQLVFVEELPSRTHKGVIACLELQGGTATRLGVALEEALHVSYPQVFPFRGEWYMTVESGRAKRVSLYKTSAFPLGWHRVKDLITDRVCADPTLHFHKGHWYLFTTIAENRNGTWDELFLFVAKQLTGPFHPHPANPIVSDVRRARSAGRLFQHGGKLVRPAQDCASDYGSAVVFNEVLELSPTCYREQPLARLAPDWAESLVACHTYSAAGWVEVLDARGHPEVGTPRLRVVIGDVPVEAPAATKQAPGPIGGVLPVGGAADVL